MAGDYYMAGDPGIFGFLGKVGKGIMNVGVGVAKSVIGATPVGAAITGITSAFGPSPNIPQMAPTPMLPTQGPHRPTIGPGVSMAPQQAAGRARNVIIGGKRFHYNKYGELKRGKIPTMNAMNPRALARSSRRIDSMRKGMGKALKHTNYKLVSKSAGKRGSSRGVITRSEAARALRG